MPHAKNRPIDKQARELLNWLNEHVEESQNRISIGVIDPENGPLEKYVRRVSEKFDLMECLPSMASKKAR